MKTAMIATVCIMILLTLSGCETYSTLYGTEEESSEPIFVPDSEIKVAGEGEEEQETDAVSSLDDVTGAVTVEEEDSDAAETDTDVEEETTDEQDATETDTNEEETEDTTEEQETDESSDEQEVEEETEPVEIDSDAVAVIVQETDTVSLEPQALDPDGDTLLFTYSSPLDEDGQWITSYGDEGEYTVTVTASDGDLASTRQVLVIVNKKEETPEILSFSPEEQTLSIEEGESLSFEVVADDKNNDPLSYEWKLDGSEVGDDEDYTYASGFDDGGSHTIKVEVSDGQGTASQLWSVDVANKNRAPTIAELSSIVVNEDEEVTIIVDADDADGDTLTLSVDDTRYIQDGSSFSWQTDFDSAGVYSVTVSASDGQTTTDTTVSVTVENVNRKPVILDIVQKE